MNFYKVDPVAGMGVAGKSPGLRQVRIKAVLDPAAYRVIKRNFFRVHCQFVSANDRRAASDYFMLVCGPFAAQAQARSRAGAASWIDSSGRVTDPPAVEAPAPGSSSLRQALR